MSVRVIIEFNLKPGVAEEMKQGLRGLLPDTRAFAGCEEITVLADQDDPNRLLILEQWATRADYEKYFAWRTERGEIAAVNEVCTKPLQPTYFDYVQV